MNRSVNILLLVVSFPAMFLLIYNMYQSGIPFVNFETAEIENQYLEYAYLAFAGLILLIAGRRAIHRWVGVGMLRKPERFYWSASIGVERKKQIRVFFIIEAIVALGFSAVCFAIDSRSWSLQLVYALIFAEQIVFILIANNWYRIGISDKALVVADREVNVLYFSGLRRVELHQQTVYFEYIEELQLFFPANAIDKSDFKGFRNALEDKLNRDKVFFSEKFKNY